MAERPVVLPPARQESTTMSDRKPLVLRNWSAAWIPVAIAVLIIAAIVIT